MYYRIYSNDGKEVFPIKPNGKQGRWRIGKEKMKDLVDKGLVVFENKNNGRIKAYRNIAEISKERIRRAGKKIKEENPLTTQGLDTGFRVLKVSSSNMEDVYYSPDEAKQGELSFLNYKVKEDRTAEDLLFQILLDCGVDLTLKIVRKEVAGKEVYYVDENELVACFDKNICEDLCMAMAKPKPLRAVFSERGFEDDSARVNAHQIFKQFSPDTEIKVL